MEMLTRRELAQYTLAAGASAAVSASAAKLAPVADGVRIGTRLDPDFTDADINFFRNHGIEYATIWTTTEKCNYEYFSRSRERLDKAGIKLLNVGNLDLHCDPTMVLGLPGVEKKLEQYQQYIRDLGRAGVRYTTYAHMANIKMAPYYATGSAETRGVKTRLFELDKAQSLPNSHGRIYHDDEIWNTFSNFLKAAIPAAEEAGVRIGLHPDDPPVPMLGGVARIFRNASAYEKAIQMSGSENFGLCFCIGTWAEGGGNMGKDVYDMIRYFGPKGRIFKVHFRNVDGALPRFKESFVDNGSIDMARAAHLLEENKVNAVLIPDHVPGEGLKGPHTAYTIGYMRAVRGRVKG